ncbi:MAG: NlpC/P60 family protein [Gammaproteobacteria bacterium]
MTDALTLIAAARTWLQTPYRHQASVKGLGADCVGFLRGAAVEAGVITPELAESLPTDYSRQPAGGELRRRMGELLMPAPLENLRPGDLLLIRFAREDQHVAMLTVVEPEPYVIHCGRQGVVEHRLDSVWTSRVTRAYRFRGLSPPHPNPLPAGEGEKM